jgi:hypothetical protein
VRDVGGNSLPRSSRSIVAATSSRNGFSVTFRRINSTPFVNFVGSSLSGVYR